LIRNYLRPFSFRDSRRRESRKQGNCLVECNDSARRSNMRKPLAVLAALLIVGRVTAADPFDKGEAIALDRVIPANERGIVCLAEHKGRVYGGTTGRAAHLFEYDPKKDHVRSIARFPGGIGMAYGLVALPDGSLICGTQADPTGIAVTTDPKAVGK